MSPECENVKENYKLGKQITFHLFCVQTRLLIVFTWALYRNMKSYSSSIERNENKSKNWDILRLVVCSSGGGKQPKRPCYKL